MNYTILTKKKRLYFIFLFTAFFLLPAVSFADKNISDTLSLRNKIAQMLIMGFRGTTIDNVDIIEAIECEKIGGIVFFEYDVPSRSRPRNIVSEDQLKSLISNLKQRSSIPLFVSIDQEGGRVSRLRAKYGFPEFPSMDSIGKKDNLDTTLYWAQKTGKTLYELGFNMNFAPCVDLNINPKNPVIGRIGRSFGNVDLVIKHANTWIDGQTQENILSVIKHFPGHGSSHTDTHLEFTNITKTWDSIELLPYKTLIDEKKCDFVMTSHVFNKNLDSVYPVTLSYKVITGILRKQLKFRGIIISDDMAMGAIANNFGLKEALDKGINAGIDIFIFSNNGMEYNPHLTEDIISTVECLVDEGKISERRIEESFQRIMQIKKEMKP